jgi:iron complex transport system substrate-binding protein/vitamin B12 transport system substrate-binding protein
MGNWKLKIENVSLRRAAGFFQFSIFNFPFVALLLLALACKGQRDAAPTHTLRDDDKRLVAVPAAVHRLVSLAPNLTEILFAIGAGPRLVGADDYSNDPPAARALPKVGGIQPNTERIVSLRPDLVVATVTAGNAALSRTLTAAGIPLYVKNVYRLADIAPAMESLGTLLGAPDGAAAARRFRDGVAGQRRTRRHPPRVLFVVVTAPLYVSGRTTFVDDMLLLCGARNAVDVEGWPQYSLETLAANPPDILLYPSQSVKPAQIEELLARLPALRRHCQIAGVDEDRFTHAGPRVPEAAAALNGILDEWEKGH